MPGRQAIRRVAVPLHDPSPRRVLCPVHRRNAKPHADIPAPEPQTGTSRAWRTPPRRITKPSDFVIATTDACGELLNH
jgi:hypothetical protein